MNSAEVPLYSREQAEKFYDHALLLVDCCKIPEAVTLLDQVCKIKLVRTEFVLVVSWVCYGRNMDSNHLIVVLVALITWGLLVSTIQ